jgi:hypothetical protein
LKRISSPQLICLGGVFVALAVLFHSAPVFLPGFGLLLSPFATLPIALAAIISTYLGITTLFSSAFILLIISPQEAIILLLTTGSLGLALGTGYGKGVFQNLIFSSATLFLGINLLTFIVGIPAFGDSTSNFALFTVIFIYLLFSLAYSVIWMFIVKCFVRLLERTKQFKGFINKGI